VPYSPVPQDLGRGLAVAVHVCPAIAQGEQAGGGVKLVADGVGGALARVVVLAAVRLDDQTRLGPVEVDGEADRAHVGLRHRQPVPVDDTVQEGDLEWRARGLDAL
jgi:hypothetical protein